MNPRDALTYCNSCDQPAADLDAAGYCPTCRAPGATVEPWTDDDTAELAEAMTEARDRIAHRWTMALRRGAMQRAHLIRSARLTDDELGTAAARYGIVADADYLPDNAGRWGNHAMRAEAAERQRETSDLWTIAARHYRHRDTYTEIFRIGPDRDFSAAVLRGEELPLPEALAVIAQAEAIDDGRAHRWPIYAAGIAATAR